MPDKMMPDYDSYQQEYPSSDVALPENTADTGIQMIEPQALLLLREFFLLLDQWDRQGPRK